ncbi:MAG: molybdenum ABC transporter ATP-binding protein [Hyphomicrobiales bacterium]|nr:molybdenum ABC transporter ATP-binding protein [Hyphomicrobiales bacterium]
MIEFQAFDQRRDFTLDVDFALNAGVSALFGPSGSGKSTILNLIAGLERPQRGRIALDGNVLLDTARGVFVPAHKRRIAVVFQDALLFPHLNVRRNIAFGRFFAPKDAPAIPQELVVAALGVGHMLDRRPATLSGGERQRVGLARALLASPRLLLMDEPLAALDDERKIEIMALIERLRAEFSTPILYVSHAVEEVVRLAQDVVVLDKGQVAAQGAPATALMRARGVMARERFHLASALDCALGAYDPAYDLTQFIHPSGQGALVGRVGPSGKPVRILVRATDIALATGPQTGLSIRTRLAGAVESIHADAGALAFVHVVLAGGDRLVASVTRSAIAELDLAPGKQVDCLIKSVALDERPVNEF